MKHIHQVRFAELAHKDLSPRWLIDGWLEANDIALIIGEPYVGKSWLAMHIALSLSRGRTWNQSFSIKHPRRVVFIDEDNPDLTAERRIMQHATQFNVTPLSMATNLRYWVSNGFNVEMLLEQQVLLRAFKPRLLVIDSLYCFGNIDVNNQREVGGLKEKLRAFQRYMVASGGLPCAVMFLHHMKKKQSKRKDELDDASIDRMYGSVYLRAMADSILILEQRGEKEYLLYQNKLRAEPNLRRKGPMRLTLGA